MTLFAFGRIDEVVVVAYLLVTDRAARQITPVPVRPSKCPKFYTNRILEEQNLGPKVRTFCQNSNRDKMTYLINYTLTAQFSI